MQYLALVGLDNYGYRKEAERITSKYFDVAAKNYIDPTSQKCGKKNRIPGWLYEKYTINGKLSDNEYCCRIQHGWSADAAAYSYAYLMNEN